MKTKHVLKTDFGVTVEMDFDEETGFFDCQWSGLPKHVSNSLTSKIKKHYLPWRDQILGNWSQRTGKKTLVITL